MLKTIGVVGAGQMGNGIAHVCALAGYDVCLSDVSEGRVKAGLEVIERNMQRQVARNKISQNDKEQSFQRVKTCVGLDGLSACDLVIEAATENEEIKKKIFRDLTKIIPDHTVLASNTSSISITSLASVTDRPDKVIGMHFMNPVPVMELIELIRGLATSDDTFQIIESLAKRLKKEIATSEDYPGFIVNRILMPMINEAVTALYEGVGSVEAIDKGMRLGTNHPMGPFELADLIGLDTCCSIMNVLAKGLSGTHYKPCPLLVNYVEAGWLGRKTGRGFYDYSGEIPVPSRKAA